MEQGRSEINSIDPYLFDSSVTGFKEHLAEAQALTL